MSDVRSDYALEMRGVSKRFPGTLAVDNVSFYVKKGEVHAIVGENGAGKSTLMKILAGLYNDYTGSILINGTQCDLHTPAKAKEYGIGMVYQELSLARSISIYENMLAGRLPKKNAIFLDKKKAIQQAIELLARVGLDHMDPTMRISEISQCEAQLVEIAKVLGTNPGILVMDEPTSALSREEVQRLFGIIRGLKEKGMAIVYISHHMQEIFEIADRITVMRDGKKVGEFRVEETNTAQLVEKMVGKSIKDINARNRSANISDDELFRVEDFTRWGFFHHVNFALRRGEVLAIMGLAGSGRTEIGRSIAGIDPLDEGRIYVEGKQRSIHSMYEAIQAGIGYLTEDRKVAGLALTQSIADNTLATRIRDLQNGPFFHSKRHKAVVADKINELSIYPPQPERFVNSLSGGNQQKVLMAKWLATDVSVLILDEPTRGVDIGAKQIIHQAVLDYVARGNAVILLSSDLPEIVELVDRVVVLREGHIIGEIQKDEITEQALLIAANGEGKHVAT